MTNHVAYEDAVDLLDADHKAVKKMFIDYDALCEDNAEASGKELLAGRICAALIVHTQLEEEMFYPQVREALVDKAIIDEAIHEHAEAKAMIGKIQRMKADGSEFDATIKKLAKMIDRHVLEEREQIFLLARQGPLDLRGLAVPMHRRKQQLTKKQPAREKEPA